MRRVIAAFVVALVAIALVGPAAQAGASPPRAGDGGASGSWWQHVLDTVRVVIAAAGSAAPAGPAATDPPSDSDRGPGMDPDGFSAPKSDPDLGPTMDPDG
jgi:hypothetical protein